ncbi:hypothetical protein AYK20_04610 [Thermoplasmatales archaeon SG8-52-1]|nr:MAG: hypothetical protein AYK20_04610 [Thermoplasmatales archaeon SG8-52-1]
MERKICLFSIGAALLLILTCIPSGAMDIIKNNENLEKDSSDNQISETVKYNVFHIKDKRDYNRKIIELTVEDSKAMWEEFKSLELQDLSPTEIFEAKFEILKNYEIVSSEMSLEEFVDVEKLEGEVNEVQTQDFDAAFAPILFVGGGLGFGLGVPLWFTSGTFIMALLGFGLVYCYDPLTAVTNEMVTVSFLPILLGYLGGFTGILLLPVVPGFFYSNALGLGMVAVTIWKTVPPMY